MQPTQVVAGIDLGGTYVRVALLTPKGKILSRQMSELVPQKGPLAGIELIHHLVQTALVESGQPTLSGIGIGATGPIDSANGRIQNPYTLPTWDDVPIVAELEKRFQSRVILENDADTAALGEYFLGAGQGVRRLYAVTVGTGIGTAFLQDGEIYRGLGGFHPEAGHHLVDPGGPLCYCGISGCWESLASGTAIAGYAREHIQGSGSLVLRLAGGDPNAVTTAMLAAAARQGDPFAQSVMQRAARYFALGLLNVMAFFVPERIVLSGGVMRSLDLFQPEIEKAVQRYSVMVPSRRISIVPAQLGYEAGMIGAAYACLRALERSSQE